MGLSMEVGVVGECGGTAVVVVGECGVDGTVFGIVRLTGAHHGAVDVVGAGVGAGVLGWEVTDTDDWHLILRPSFSAI